MSCAACLSGPTKCSSSKVVIGSWKFVGTGWVQSDWNSVNSVADTGSGFILLSKWIRVPRISSARARSVGVPISSTISSNRCRAVFVQKRGCPASTGKSIDGSKGRVSSLWSCERIARLNGRLVGEIVAFDISEARAKRIYGIKSQTLGHTPTQPYFSW